ncbi:MAG: poly-gamma-glutamate hydrolase family protein [Actinobacteria bacterium]|nr:poly-gamma-glutamate hydrolase family protein [Actinomycetota bacterium]
MPTYKALVRKRSGSNGERCAANHSDLKRIGKGPGQQVRVSRSEEALALYTVEKVSLDTPRSLEMTGAGMRRLNGPNQFDVTVDAQVVREGVTDEEASARGEFVERLTAGRARKLCVIAPHGGKIERYTDAQAEHVGAALKAATPWVWTCKGWGLDNDAFARWHITSTDISPESFPFLKRMIRARFTHAISFHGFDISNFPGPEVRIGGLADPALKELVRKAIQDRFRKSDKTWTVGVEKAGDRFSGIGVRRFMGTQIADAVAAVYQRVFAA